MKLRPPSRQNPHGIPIDPMKQHLVTGVAYSGNTEIERTLSGSEVDHESQHIPG
jgi:hypothetical protein